MTIKDIARESGYAVSTVSRVINNHPNVSEEAKVHIQAIVAKHKFVLNNNAKQLKQQQNLNILIIAKGTSNALFASILETIQLSLKKSDYATAINYIDEDANEVIAATEICRVSKPSGIIFLGGNAKFFREDFKEISIPCVLVTSTVGDMHFNNLSTVSIDDVQSGEMVIDYLVENGHRHIGIIGGDHDVSDVIKQRLEGSFKSFKRNDISFDMNKDYQRSRFSYKSAYEGMNKLYEKSPQITAVFAMSDLMAIGAISAIRDMGKRVPEDISVIGFDGLEIGKYYSPKLSTVIQPMKEIGEKASKLILNLIRGMSTGESILINGKLSRKESVMQRKN